MSIGRQPPLANRGDIFIVSEGPDEGHESKQRPWAVISPAHMNYSGTVMVIPFSTQKLDRVRDWEVLVPAEGSGLREDSKAKADQIQTVTAERLIRRIGVVPEESMVKIDRALTLSTGLEDRIIA
jgi:mRNA interferase MazF